MRCAGQGRCHSGATIASVSSSAKIGDLAADAGLKRIHILAWRDLDDVEAGGSEIHADRVASVWAESGIEVTMRTSHAAGASTRVRRNGYQVIRRGGRYLVFPRAAVAELLGRHGHTDALVEIWNGMPFLSPLWTRLPHVAWVHHAHTKLWSTVLPRYRAAAGRVLERDLAPRLYSRTPVVTLSQSARSQLVNDFGLRRERVHVVEPGIDDRWRIGADPPGEASPSDDAKDPAPLLVAVGRLMTYKNFQRVIRVVARLREQAPPQASCTRLMIVGHGPERNDLMQLVSELDAHEWCTVTGRISDRELAALYRRCWALVSASLSEGWGMTITEAAAAATPSVVSNITGHADAVVEGQTGHLFDSDDEFAAALEKLICDQGHRERLGAAAARRSASLTWERAAHGTLAVLADEAIRRRR